MTCHQSGVCVHPLKMAGHPVSRKEPPIGADRQIILWDKQAKRPYNALETPVFVAVPSCTVVAGQIDVTSGGEGKAEDPDEKTKKMIDWGLPTFQPRSEKDEKQRQTHERH